MRDGLKDAHREAIIATLAANDRVERAVLFGSRATGTNTVSSDVDIALFGDRLTLTDHARLAAALDEIPMAQSVDLLLYDSLQDRTLREHIRNQGIEWFARPMATSSFVSPLFDASESWPTMPFSDLVFFQEGPGIRNWQYRTQGVPFVNIRCLVNGRLDVGAMNCLDPQEVQEKYRHFLLDEGDYIVSSSGTIGRIAEVCREDLPCMLNTSVIRMRPRDDKILDRRFLRYFLTSSAFQDQIRSLASGSVQVNYGPTHLEQVSILVPPHSEQRSIGHILGTLDDKIELNRRMNATLEAMARTLFRSWFVDFDPVRAKMEGRDTGLPKEIADLFPDRLVDSEQGEIPEGWSAGTLGDIAAAPRSGIDPGRVADDTPYIGLEHMPRRSVALTDWGRAGSVSSIKTAFENRDVLFGKLRPYFHKVGIAPVNGVCSTDIVVLKARMPEWSAFVLACVSSSGFVGYASQTSTGTKMPRTSWRTMSRYEMCRPSVAVAAAFQHVVSPMFERIVASVHESRTLGRLRDALLPKLVSGELRVNGLVQASESIDSPAPVGTHGA